MFISLVEAALRGLLFNITGSYFAAEFSGYWLNRLMHNDRFSALTRAHRMQHFR
jgi:hypothetical protein